MTTCRAIAKSTGRRCQNEAGEDGYCHIESHGEEAPGRLTDKQRLFIERYLVHFNGRRAAIEAKYSENCAEQIAYENLRKPHIRAYIDQRLDESTLTADEALKRLSDTAKADVSQYIIHEGGGLYALDLEQMKEDGCGHLIKSIVNTQSGARFDLHDAQDALKTILKAHGAFGAKGTADDPIYNVDFSKLTNEQLIRIADGEPAGTVIKG